MILNSDQRQPHDGKTGTVQVRHFQDERESGVLSNKELDWHLRDHSLFVGYAPHKNPRYAISIVIEHGGGGLMWPPPLRATLWLNYCAMKAACAKRGHHELHRNKRFTRGCFCFRSGPQLGLILTVFLLGLVGVGTLYSAAGGSFEPWAWRHGLRLIVGLLMLAVAALDVRLLHNGAYLVFGGLLLLLLSVHSLVM